MCAAASSHSNAYSIPVSLSGNCRQLFLFQWPAIQSLPLRRMMVSCKVADYGILEAPERQVSTPKGLGDLGAYVELEGVFTYQRGGKQVSHPYDRTLFRSSPSTEEASQLFRAKTASSSWCFADGRTLGFQGDVGSRATCVVSYPRTSSRFAAAGRAVIHYRAVR